MRARLGHDRVGQAHHGVRLSRRGRDGWRPGRRPATQASREWVHHVRLPVPRFRQSGSSHRARDGLEVTICMARHPVKVESVGCAAAAESRRRISPSESSWNCVVDPVPRDVRAAGIAGQLRAGARQGPALAVDAGRRAEARGQRPSTRSVTNAVLRRRGESIEARCRRQRFPRSTGRGSRRSGSRSLRFRSARSGQAHRCGRDHAAVGALSDRAARQRRTARHEARRSATSRERVLGIGRSLLPRVAPGSRGSAAVGR